MHSKVKSAIDIKFRPFDFISVNSSNDFCPIMGCSDDVSTVHRLNRQLRQNSFSDLSVQLKMHFSRFALSCRRLNSLFKL